MSTSLLVTKMRKAAEEKGVEVEINAVALELFEENVNKYDIFLLGHKLNLRKPISKKLLINMEKL